MAHLLALKCLWNKFQKPAKGLKNVRFASFCRTETAWHCGTDCAFEGQLVVAPSAPELPASEGDAVATPKQHGTAGWIGPSQACYVLAHLLALKRQ